MIVCGNCFGSGKVKKLKLTWAAPKRFAGQRKATTGRTGSDELHELACPVCGGSGRRTDRDSEDD